MHELETRDKEDTDKVNELAMNNAELVELKLSYQSISFLSCYHASK